MRRFFYFKLLFMAIMLLVGTDAVATNKTLTRNGQPACESLMTTGVSAAMAYSLMEGELMNLRDWKSRLLMTVDGGNWSCHTIGLSKDRSV